jgi:hypothetical protein
MLEASCMTFYDWETRTIEDILKLFSLERINGKVPREKLSAKVIRCGDNKRSLAINKVGWVMNIKEFLSIQNMWNSDLKEWKEVRWQYQRTTRNIDYFIVGQKGRKETIVTAKKTNNTKNKEKWTLMVLEVERIIPKKWRSPQLNHGKIIQKPNIFNEI